MQAPARQSWVQASKAGTDILAEQLVAHAGQAVGVAQQAVQDLGIEEQRAAAQQVLGEEFGQGLDFAQLVNGRLVMEAQPLAAPARHQGQIIEGLLIALEVDLVRV